MCAGGTVCENPIVERFVDRAGDVTGVGRVAIELDLLTDARLVVVASLADHAATITPRTAGTARPTGYGFAATTSGTVFAPLVCRSEATQGAIEGR